MVETRSQKKAAFGLDIKEFSSGPAMVAAYIALAAIVGVSNFVYVDKYLHMFAISVLVLYIGAHRSVTVPAEEKAESMTAKDASMFPVYGSCVLFGLYVMYKFVWKELIVFLLTGYIVFLGIMAIGYTLSPLLNFLVPRPVGEKKVVDTKFNLPSWIPEFIRGTDPWEIDLNVVEIIGICFGVVVAAWYLYTGHWVANNIIGIAFSISALEVLNLGSFKIGAMLLAGLFVYDCFWVFGTEVMVTVAKGFNVPIKLVFPKSLELPLKLSMLGLGDIVVPGMFVAMCIRFDVNRARAKGTKVEKTYFYTVWAGYALGLATTIFVMHVFEAAQPALLYLVPGCLFSVFGLAATRGEVGELWSYNEDDHVEKPEKKTE